jgi:hypothetical protein
MVASPALQRGAGIVAHFALPDIVCRQVWLINRGRARWGEVSGLASAKFQAQMHEGLDLAGQPHVKQLSVAVSPSPRLEKASAVQHNRT